ncbi:MAG: general secretion pathway protein GspE [Deltaproteobacteria bacterium]|nr:general secretion pathway protein GspE [Deltaproteobacteria bacterium]
MRIRIGDLLVKAGVITDAQLKAALTEQGQWGGKLGDILVRMEFLTEEVLVRALSKQSGIPRADLTGDGDAAARDLIPPDVAEEFGVVPLALQDEGRTLVVAMSDPLNLMVTDHLRSLTGGLRIVAQIAGTGAIRNAISRWYRGQELMGDEEEPSIKITNNAGGTVATGKPPPAPKDASATVPDQRPVSPQRPAPPRPPPPKAPPPVPAQQTSAVDVLRGVEETQRRSVAAMRAMVELLIEKGVFSRDEYLSRVKR